MKSWIGIFSISFILLSTIFALFVGGVLGAKLMSSMDTSLALSGATGGSAIFLTGMLLGLTVHGTWASRCRRLAVYCGNFAIGSISMPMFSLMMKDTPDWSITVLGGLFGFCVGNIVVGKQ